MNPAESVGAFVVHEFSEDPATAVNKGLSCRRMTVPSVDTLGARCPDGAVRSAEVGWVDLLMTSGPVSAHAKTSITRDWVCGRSA